MKSNLTSKKVVLTSFFVDTLDIIFNGAIAFSTGSSIMLAEFLQGLADLVTVAFLYIGIKRSVKRADREHSFGYGRELYFWSLCSAIIMFAGTATLSFYFVTGNLPTQNQFRITFWRILFYRSVSSLIFMPYF